MKKYYCEQCDATLNNRPVIYAMDGDLYCTITCCEKSSIKAKIIHLIPTDIGMEKFGGSEDELL